MKTYTAMVSWFIHGKRITMKEKTIRNIKANSTREARELAIKQVPKGFTPYLNCIWYN